MVCLRGVVVDLTLGATRPGGTSPLVGIDTAYARCVVAADLRAARAGVLEQVARPLPGAWFAEGAMTAVGRAIGFDGYCLFGVDPLSGLRSVMFLLVRGSSGGPRSPRLYDILRPEGYASELRLALISGDRYWAVSLFRDDVRHPFTDADVDAALDLSEPLSQAVRRYQTGRPGTQPLPRRPGVVMVDGDDVPVAVTREAHDWLVDLADSWRYGATEDDVSRIVLEVARAARAGREPVCRVRMPRGEWLVVSGSRVEDTDCDVAVVLQAGDLGTVAPAFAAWCGLSPKESEVLHLVASGLAAKQIARRLRLSVLTVNDHLKSVYRKAHVNSREELVSLL